MPDEVDVSEDERMLERFEGGLKQRKLKLTKQRRAIARAFFSSKGHVSLSDLLARAQERQGSIGYATVYRTMRLMVECGVAVEHKFTENAEALFEPHVDGDHHDHIICLTCGNIFEFEDEVIEARQDALAERAGFVVKRHRLEIYGDCIKTDCEHRS